MPAVQSDGPFHFRCYLCPESFQFIIDATNHLKFQHGAKNGDSLKCMAVQTDSLFCTVSFKSFTAVRNHMKQKKCKLLSSDTSDFPQQKECEGSCDGWDPALDDFGKLFIDSSNTSTTIPESIAEYTEEFINKLIVSNVPHNIVNDIVKFSKQLVCKTFAIIGSSNTTKNDLNAVLSSTEQLVASELNKFGSRFKRAKKFENSPHYVAPKTFTLDGGESFQYVPIIGTLNVLFSNDNFQKEYFHYNSNHFCKHGIYERTCCGENFKNNDFFRSNENAIQIQLFFDDVQLTSPLKTKPYKMSSIYFIVRNLPANFTPKLRQHVFSILMRLCYC